MRASKTRLRLASKAEIRRAPRAALAVPGAAHAPRCETGRQGRSSRCCLALLATLLLACGAQRPPQDPRDAWQPTDALAPPAPDRSWQPPPAAASYRAPRDAWRAGDDLRALPDAGTTYDLPALVDLALRDNPSTRGSWEAARAAAARYGQSLAPYYPTVALTAHLSPNQRVLEPGPTDALTLRWDKYEPSVTLTYTLLDFGRRAQTAERARQQLVAANFAFNRTMQDIVFGVQAAYYQLDATQSLQIAAEQNLALARTVLAAADARLAVGLATRPEQLLAKQVETRAVYELENAKVAVQNAQAGLALALGIPANAPLAIESLAEQALPPELEHEVDAFIDRALIDRPDLAARLADLRAAEASVGRAKAEFFPSLGFAGLYGVQDWDYTVNSGNRIGTTQTQYATVFRFDWTLFDGLERLNTLRGAEADAAAARAGLASAQLDIIAEVWRAYYDYRAAVRKVSFADALLAASQDAYDANKQTYGQGLSNIVDLLTAERDLANARYTRVLSRAELLITAARVAYAAGSVRVP